jgi:hypothetical protein
MHPRSIGIGLHDYVLAKRIAHANELMSEGRKVTEVRARRLRRLRELHPGLQEGHGMFSGGEGMSYESTWNSLRKHQAPQWLRDGKFGIYTHWGIYSVPAFGPNVSWYPHNRA